MKMQMVKDYKALDAWKKKPRGYVVLTVTPTAKIESVETGTRIVLVRVASNADRAVKQLERIREEFDLDADGMRPRVVVVKSAVADDPRAMQFMRRAEVVVEV